MHRRARKLNNGKTIYPVGRSKKQQGLDPRCFLPTLTDFLELALRFFRACPELAEGLPLLDAFRMVDWKQIDLKLKNFELVL